MESITQGGLPIEDVVRFKKQNNKLLEFPQGEKIDGKEFLELPCDILVPSATEMQITQENAAGLKCRLLIEGANGPTTLEADKVLTEKASPRDSRHPCQCRRGDCFLF